jgi:hypothetical protein
MLLSTSQQAITDRAIDRPAGIVKKNKTEEAA